MQATRPAVVSVRGGFAVHRLDPGLAVCSSGSCVGPCASGQPARALESSGVHQPCPQSLPQAPRRGYRCSWTAPRALALSVVLSHRWLPAFPRIPFPSATPRRPPPTSSCAVLARVAAANGAGSGGWYGSDKWE